MKKLFCLILTLALALSLGALAFAETAETAPAAGTTTEEALEAANALNEALTAYQSAKAASRKQAVLDSLKQELDSYVAAGTLTQDQADLILKYYTEQMTLNPNSSGKGGRMIRNGGQTNGQTGNTNGFGKGGRHGRFGTQPVSPQTEQTSPETSGT